MAETNLVSRPDPGQLQKELGIQAWCKIDIWAHDRSIAQQFPAFDNGHKKSTMAFSRVSKKMS